MTRVTETIWTVGHGNRSLENLISLLSQSQIAILADIRAFPSSKRHPQFEQSCLSDALSARGIQYQWEGKNLGGFRKPKSNSPHIALKSEGFRGYADHMQSPMFAEGIARLLELAAKSRVAIMCSERDPFHCHRSLVSDYLVSRDVKVVHVIDIGETQNHSLNSLARGQGNDLVYDRSTQPQLNLL